MSVKRRRRADRGAWCCGIRGAKCSLLEDLRVPAARGWRFARCETPAQPEVLPDSQSRAIQPVRRERELHIRWWFDQWSFWDKHPCPRNVALRASAHYCSTTKSQRAAATHNNTRHDARSALTLSKTRRETSSIGIGLQCWVVAWSVPRQHSTYTHLTACTSPSAMCLYRTTSLPLPKNFTPCRASS